MNDPASPISLAEGRFARLQAIKWWDQPLLRRARVLVVGAGAIGNEVIKNLSLLGVGRLVVVDMDSVEESNLCRSVLFRQADQGSPKAHAAARGARELYDGIAVHPIVGNVLSDVGLGLFRWAQVVVGALDNREARVFVNRACAQVRRPWIDGGIDVLSGIVRGFAPPDSACYECIMGQADWDQLAKRRSCSLLARNAIRQGGTPTTPTTASIIGAVQAQEVVKLLHGLESLTGAGYVFEGLTHQSYRVSYPISPDCPWHETPPEIRSFEYWNSQTPLREIWNWASAEMGGLDAIDLSRELVERLTCPSCGRDTPILRPIECISRDQAICATCGGEMAPTFVHSLCGDSPLLALGAGGIGLPPWDILWVRRGQAALGVELGGDRPQGEMWQ